MLTQQITAYLKPLELEALKKAKDKLRTDGVKNPSVKTILLRGIYEIIGVDITKDT